MKSYQRGFIELALKRNALQFGEFTLKSGRISPYFFNAGLFNSGSDLAKLGEFYADALMEASLQYDVIFGPAYKGIPLVTSTAVALSTKYQHDVSYSFNRKEKKTHGEGGEIVGASLKGKIIIIDDVITAGTAIRESMALISSHNASVIGVMVAFDRQEKGTNERSAIQEIEQNYGATVISLVKLDDIISYLGKMPSKKAALVALRKYQQQYGAT